MSPCLPQTMVVTSGSQTQQRPLVEEDDTKNNLPVPVEKEKKKGLVTSTVHSFIVKSFCCCIEVRLYIPPDSWAEISLERRP